MDISGDMSLKSYLDYFYDQRSKFYSRNISKEETEKIRSSYDRNISDRFEELKKFAKEDYIYKILEDISENLPLKYIKKAKLQFEGCRKRLNDPIISTLKGVYLEELLSMGFDVVGPVKSGTISNEPENSNKLKVLNDKIEFLENKSDYVAKETKSDLRRRLLQRDYEKRNEKTNAEYANVSEKEKTNSTVAEFQYTTGLEGNDGIDEDNKKEVIEKLNDILERREHFIRYYERIKGNSYARFYAESPIGTGIYSRILDNYDKKIISLADDIKVSEENITLENVKVFETDVNIDLRSGKIEILDEMVSKDVEGPTSQEILENEVLSNGQIVTNNINNKLESQAEVINDVIACGK